MNRRPSREIVVRYVTAREAMEALCLSPRSLLRLRADGVFEAGKCWIRKVPSNPNSDVLYDLLACQHALSAATIAAQIEQDRLGQREVELA